MAQQNEGCLLCGAPIIYHAHARPMVCAVCNTTQNSRAQCENGHYVCDTCHQKGAAAVVPALCLSLTQSDPLIIAKTIMRHPAVHMHGPEHHFIAGAALLCAYHNLTGDVDLPVALDGGRAVPGGTCGFWGVCGAAISTGVYLSVLTGATPYSVQPWRLCNAITARCLRVLSDVGGPRCCKRVTYLCIEEAARFTHEHFGVNMPLCDDFSCDFYTRNAQCITTRCPFYPS